MQAIDVKWYKLSNTLYMTAQIVRPMGLVESYMYIEYPYSVI